MQKALLILLLVCASCVATHAQAQEGYKTWEEVAQAVDHGEPGAVNKLLKLKQQIEDNNTLIPETYDNYVTAVHILNAYYSRQGLYQEQETLLGDAIRFFNRHDSVANNPYTRQLWMLKAQSQVDIKNYDAAINYGMQALAFFAEADDYGLDYCLTCLNVANALFVKGDLLDAKLYVDETLDKMRPLISNGTPKDRGYLQAINLRGLIHERLKQYDKAIADLKEVVNLSSPDGWGSPHDMAANNLATIYILTGKTSEAIGLLQSMKSATVEERKTKYENLTWAHILAGNDAQAIQCQKAYNQEKLSDALHVASNFSEVEREAYLSSSNLGLITLNDVVAAKVPEATKDAFDMNVFARMLSLYVSEHLQRKNTTDVAKLQTLRQRLITKGLTRETTDSIRLNIIELEKRLLRADSSLVKAMPLADWSFDHIASSLEEDEALVLFCYAPSIQAYPKVDARYGAFVVRKGDRRPTLIPLGNVNVVDSLSYRLDPTAEFLSGVYTGKKAQQLYQLLWQPLEQRLKKGDHVYYSTINTLSTLNMDALNVSKDTRLRDIYDLVRLSSPTEKSHATQTLRPRSFMAFGAPAFDLAPHDRAANATWHSPHGGEDISLPLRLRGDNLRGDWQPIPGTRKETETIVSLMGAKGVEAKALLGKDASEEAFKSLSGHSPAILHVATHGFAISTQAQYERSPFVQSVTGVSPNNTYLLMSGLVLAGGNATWRGDTLPDGVEDGILTANEIAQLDLSGTDLVVLSACETGQGHIDPVEGTWGLQRAFKQAGVKSILMTLWKVSDDITALFMEQFYRNLLDGKTVRQSVRRAQDHLIAHGAADPFYWAPFVVLD